MDIINSENTKTADEEPDMDRIYRDSLAALSATPKRLAVCQITVDLGELPSRTVMAFRHPGYEWDNYAAIIVAAYTSGTLRTEAEYETLTAKKRGAYPPPIPYWRH